MKEVKRPPLDWVSVIFLSVSPLIAVVGTGIYTYFNGVHVMDIALFSVYYVLTGLSITAGYHRYFSHKSYQSHSLLTLAYLVFGACAVENSVYRWASDHRYHHTFVDTDKDPYNIKKGGWFAHIGWIFFKRKDSEERYENVQDLRRDPLVMWQHRYYVPILMLGGFLVPTLIGLLVGRPLGGLLWGGFVRVVFVHHATFFINSLAHIVGKQPYSTVDTSKDSWWLAFLTYGEGYHNYHHAFPADYRNGIKWYQWDPSKWFVWSMSRVGLARKLFSTPSPAILRARVSMDINKVHKRLLWISSERRVAWQAQLEAGQMKLQQAAVCFAEAKVKYKKIKSEGIRSSQENLMRWKLKMKSYKTEFVEARQAWRRLIREACATPI